MGTEEKSCVYPGCTWKHSAPHPPTMSSAVETELAIKSHLDESHEGWTIEEVREHAAARRVQEVLGLGPNEMFKNG